MALTVDQARAIADAFLDAANGVDEYLKANYQKISRGEYEFLYESAMTLLRVSTWATTAAVGLAIDAMTDPATKLKNVIDEAKEKIKELQDVDRVIRFVAGLADLGAAIMAKDPNAIVTAVTNLDKLDGGVIEFP